MLDKKTALITGASRGIGKAIVILFAQHRAFVGINYLAHHEQAQQVLQEVKKSGGDGLLLQGDISQQHDVQHIINTLVNHRKTIDILVLNAGIYKRKTIDTLDWKEWHHVLDVNLNSCYHMVKHSLPYLNEKGKIIFLSSQLAFKGTDHGADYATSKAGMLGFMRSLALELAPKNITVNAVAPGTIDTDIIAHYTTKQREKRSKEIPLQRLGQPEDVAKTCLFLASDLSSYITGETIHVNGGLYIH